MPLRIITCLAACILWQAASQSTRGQERSMLEPTLRNVAYGPHERNVIDVWQAPGDEPTPFVLYIHGGGFAVGDKDTIGARKIKPLLDAGLSVVTVNYRYYTQAPLPAALHDCRRALQYVRSRADEWNLDKTRAAATGGSAGAIASMYLAFHDDMARPDSDDPVERESTRLTCVAASSGQTTLDTAWWAANVPGWPADEGVKKDVHAWRRWGCSEEDFPALIQDGSALELISPDDPPIWMSYSMAPDDPISTTNELYWKVHHVAFGVALKEKMDRLGLEARLLYPGARETPYSGMVGFFVAKLKPEADGNE